MRGFVLCTLASSQRQSTSTAGQQAAGAVRLANAVAQPLRGAYHAGILPVLRLKHEQKQQLAATIALMYQGQQLHHHGIHSVSFRAIHRP